MLMKKSRLLLICTGLNLEMRKQNYTRLILFPALDFLTCSYGERGVGIVKDTEKCESQQK